MVGVSARVGITGPRAALAREPGIGSCVSDTSWEIYSHKLCQERAILGKEWGVLCVGTWWDRGDAFAGG